MKIKRSPRNLHKQMNCKFLGKEEFYFVKKIPSIIKLNWSSIKKKESNSMKQSEC